MSGASPSLAPEVDDLRRQFEQVAAEVEALVGPLTDAQFLWKPSPEVWSIAECLEHLNASARAYLPVLDAGIDEAIRHGTYGPGPFRYNWLGRLTTGIVEPPPRFRVRAPRPLQPETTRGRREITAGFAAFQTQFIDRLRQANGIDLARARVHAPGIAWLRIPLGCGFAVMAAHERRHLWQVRQLVAAPGFPRA